MQNEPQAELLCSFLRAEGIRCGHRITDVGAGAWDGVPTGGPREVLVDPSDLQAARQALVSAEHGEFSA
ncbi:MAG: hypothetical protein ACXWZP_09680 [Gaiellaceae bacterium]